MARGVAASRAAAQRAIAEGRVSVAGAPHPKPSTAVTDTTPIVVEAGGYVGRGGDKLAGALDQLPIAVTGRRALDVGASTGGFTEVLLRRGAASVTALDVGHGQLHPRLRNHPRLTNREGVNLRHVTADDLGGRFGLIVADLSFISLCTVAGALAALAAAAADLLLLVKPQFEVGRDRLGKSGVVHDPALHQAAIDRVSACLAECGLTTQRVVPTSVPGEHGNRELFLWCRP